MYFLPLNAAVWLQRLISAPLESCPCDLLSWEEYVVQVQMRKIGNYLESTVVQSNVFWRASSCHDVFCAACGACASDCTWRGGPTFQVWQTSTLGVLQFCNVLPVSLHNWGPVSIQQPRGRGAELGFLGRWMWNWRMCVASPATGRTDLVNLLSSKKDPLGPSWVSGPKHGKHRPWAWCKAIQTCNVGYWSERISIEINLLSIHLNSLSIDFPSTANLETTKSPHTFLCTIGYHPNNYIIEDLGHSWGTPLKNCLGAVV